jgi:hypothetical protein
MGSRISQGSETIEGREAVERKEGESEQGEAVIELAGWFWERGREDNWPGRLTRFEEGGEEGAT